MSRNGWIVGHRCEEPADERAPAVSSVGLRGAETFVVQRATHKPWNRPSRLSGNAFETMWRMPSLRDPATEP